MIMLEGTASDKRSVYIFSGIFLAVLLSLLFVSKTVSRPVTAFFLVLAAVTATLIIKKRAIPSIHKKTITLILAVSAATLIAIYYLSETSFGYFKNPYASTFGKSAYYIISLIASIISFEIIRNILLAQESKLATVLITLSGIAVDILISTRIILMLTFNSFMDLVGLVLFPAVSANLFFNYISSRYGAMPNAIYRLIVMLYIYIIPVLPGMPDPLLSLFRLFIPIFLYVFVDILYEKKRKYATKKNKKSKLGLVGSAVAIVAAMSLIMLISCQFRYKLIVIATGSMTGELNKGDAIIYEEYDGDNIEIGEIIVFEKDDNATVHRVIDVEHINGETRYYTKGDANDSPDVGYITSSNIRGKVNFKIAYIGYPTLFMRSLFDGNK